MKNKIVVQVSFSNIFEIVGITHIRQKSFKFLRILVLGKRTIICKSSRD